MKSGRPRGSWSLGQVKRFDPRPTFLRLLTCTGHLLLEWYDEAMKAVIMTVGTSLLTNHGWKRGQNLPTQDEALEWATDRDKESAEMSTWKDIAEMERLVLIATNSPEAILCAEALSALWEGSLVKVVRGLDMKSSVSRYEEGLKEFSDLLLGEIERARKDGLDPALAVTAGTKGQTAMAFLVGAVSSVPCLYRHETHEGNGLLPPLPIMWDKSFFDRTRGFWEALDDQRHEGRPTLMDYHEKEEAISQFSPQDRRLLSSMMIQMEDEWTTTAAGHLFLRHFLKEEIKLTVGESILMSSVARRQWDDLKDGRARDTMRKNASRVWIRIAEGNPTFSSKNGSDLLFFPTGGRKANSHVSINRLENGEYALCEFFFSHDDRDRHLRSDQAWAARYEDFGPVVINER
jgi:putative CRISPR-associated protein (TIGR02619 family)